MTLLLPLCCIIELNLLIFQQGTSPICTHHFLLTLVILYLKTEPMYEVFVGNYSEKTIHLTVLKFHASAQISWASFRGVKTQNLSGLH